MTNNFFLKFSYEYQQDKLLKLFQDLMVAKKFTKQNPWIHADHEEVLKNKDILPMSDFFVKELNVNDFGLSMMVGKSGIHTNKKNNGLIIFPLKRHLVFDFNEYPNIIIDTPTVINGSQEYNFYPNDTMSIFYALKIPLELSWDETIKLINDRQ
jgi:hypothetical protein